MRIGVYLYFCIHVHAYVYIHVKYVYFASFYLSNCDVLGSRPKVCYCNTFSEKKKVQNSQKTLLYMLL